MDNPQALQQLEQPMIPQGESHGFRDVLGRIWDKTKEVVVRSAASLTLLGATGMATEVVVQSVGAEVVFADHECPRGTPGSYAGDTVQVGTDESGNPVYKTKYYCPDPVVTTTEKPVETTQYVPPTTIKQAPPTTQKTNPTVAPTVPLTAAPTVPPTAAPTGAPTSAEPVVTDPANPANTDPVVTEGASPETDAPVITDASDGSSPDSTIKKQVVNVDTSSSSGGGSGVIDDLLHIFPYAAIGGGLAAGVGIVVIGKRREHNQELAKLK